jgi:Ni/Fe-hydrogenase subunit HybB-like protein
MFKAVKDYAVFCWRVYKLSFRGGPRFIAWMTFLTVLSLIGLRAYANQLVHGLATTGMTDHVSWGAYIANFTFLVGVAAAAVMLVIPAYIYHNEALHKVVLLGELLAIAAIVMCTLFVMVDLGRPDRFWHLMPGVGKFNFPGSMLSWDVIALNGYLVLNAHICGYLLYMKYLGREPSKLFYVPVVFVAIFWAVSIHTVTAFLYVGLGGRPFWHHPIIAPRFLASAFVAGPALIILVFQTVRRATDFWIENEAIFTLKKIMTVSMFVNVFLLFCEVFTEFYADTYHVAAAEYLYFGLHGRGALVPWIWTAVALDLLALLIFATSLSKRLWALNAACLMAFVGIWIEKGMGLIIPGFVPTPLGEVVEYLPTLNETLVCMGIWAFGALLYSWMLHISLPILKGEFHIEEAPLS